MGARVISVVAFLLTLGGIGLLGRGVYRAAPLIYWYTDVENALAREGRHFVLVATLLLIVAAGLFAARGQWVSAALVALPGVVCAALVYGFSAGGWATLAFYLVLPLVLAALVGAVMAVLGELDRPSAWITVTLAVMPAVIGLALVYGFKVKGGGFPVALYLVLPLAVLALGAALWTVLRGA